MLRPMWGWKSSLPPFLHLEPGRFIVVSSPAISFRAFAYHERTGAFFLAQFLWW